MEGKVEYKRQIWNWCYQQVQLIRSDGHRDACFFFYIIYLSLNKWRNIVCNCKRAWICAVWRQLTAHFEIYWEKLKKVWPKIEAEKKMFAWNDQRVRTCCLLLNKTPHIFIFFVSFQAQMAKFRICGRSIICNGYTMCCTCTAFSFIQL